MGEISVPVLPGVSSADLEQLPIERLEAEFCTMAAFAAGELSYSKVRAITRVARVSTEAEWLRKAEEATTAQLEEAVRAYRRAIDPRQSVVADPEPDDVPADCSTRHTEDGRVQILFDLPADEGGEVLNKLDRRADEIFQEQGGSAEPELRLSHSERRARALVELMSETFPHSPSDPDDDRYLVVFHAGATPLGVNAWIEGGPPVSAERLAEVLCDQPLSLLVEDDYGNPLYLGRATRQLNRRQRRALRYRDGSCCRFPGCTRTKRINGHHVAWWERDKGPTDIDNLCSLCPLHHRLIHQLKFFIKVDGDGQFVFTRPDGTVLEESPAPPPVSMTVEQANYAVGVDIAAAPAAGDGYPQDLALTVDSLLASFGVPN